MPALDGLRAVAVFGVLAFHGGMPWATGGFLGVDAFFVLSGYLITSLLVAEWEQSGRIDLPAFWKRRARRLLPALLLMVGVITLGARVLLPAEELRLLRGDGLAALFYVANWRMIVRGGDYFAQTASPSPLEHTWSLGIEEQFYVAWPLLVSALLVGTVVAGARRVPLRRAILLCAIGVAISTVLLAALYRPDDPGRAYYGTDTRGASLLVGAGLAILLVRHWTTGGEDSARPAPAIRTLLGGASALSFVVLGWAWTHADGGDTRLYRGGLALLAVAVGVVIAHVVLVPRGWSARLLSTTPLVLVGRISYGIYLWHWPMFIAVNAERTGLQGIALFTARCLVTLTMALVSYVAVERPIRTGALSGRLRFANGAGALAGVATVAVLVVVTTAVPPRLAQAGSPLAGQVGTEDGIDAVASAGPGHSDLGGVDRQRGGGQTSHHRAGARQRHPRAGRTPVIDVFGDSVAWTLVTYLPTHPELDVRDRTMLGCGIARTAPYRYFGQTYNAVARDCRAWPDLWRRAIAVDDPDVALILVGRWETMDRMVNGDWSHVGAPAFDAYLRSELELAITTAGARGAQVVLATEPYNRRGEQLDGSLYPEDQPERVTAWNTLLRAVADDHPGTRVLDLGKRVSPEGEFTWTAGGVQIRSDGVHLTPSGVQEWIAPWLLPQLQDLVIR